MNNLNKWHFYLAKRSTRVEGPWGLIAALPTEFSVLTDFCRLSMSRSVSLYKWLAVSSSCHDFCLRCETITVHVGLLSSLCFRISYCKYPLSFWTKLANGYWSCFQPLATKQHQSECPCPSFLMHVWKYLQEKFLEVWLWIKGSICTYSEWNNSLKMPI